MTRKTAGFVVAEVLHFVQDDKLVWGDKLLHDDKLVRDDKI
jgi:hypothetical protein